MKPLGWFTYTIGVVVITYAITRRQTFFEVAPRIPEAGEGDDRFIAANYHMILWGAIGIVLLLLGAYFCCRKKAES